MRASLFAVFAAVLLTSSASERPARPGTMLAPSERKPLPAFETLTGRFPTDSFARDDVKGRVTVVNLWYEF